MIHGTLGALFLIALIVLLFAVWQAQTAPVVPDYQRTTYTRVFGWFDTGKAEQERRKPRRKYAHKYF